MIVELILPVLAALMLLAAVRVYLKIQSPPPLAFQCIPPELCPVFYDQVMGDIEKIEDAGKSASRRLRRQAVWMNFRLNWFYVLLRGQQHENVPARASFREAAHSYTEVGIEVSGP